MTLEDTLQSWIENSFFNFSEGDGSDDPPLEGMVDFIGSKIFSLPKGTNFYGEVEKVFGIKLTLKSEMLEYFLIYAVSQRCPFREDFIKDIMSLDRGVQIDLMSIIKRHEESESADIDSDIEPEFTEIVVVPEKLCRTCNERDLVIEHLKHELQMKTKEDQEMIVKLTDELNAEKAKFVDAELKSIERTEQLRKKDASVLELQRKVAELESSKQSVVALRDHNMALKDELDVLRPQAERLAVVEGQLEKMRERVETLNDTKRQLNEESLKHDKTHAKMMEYLQEVEQLRKLKPQLEEYRSSHAESAIVLQELRSKLQECEETIAALSAENKSLSGSQHTFAEQSKCLNDELREAAEQLRVASRVGGVGEGVSELNPELMQELHRLRTENSELLSMLDLTAMDRLEEQSKDNADLQAINQSLQKKWSSAKDALEKALSNIESLKRQLLQKESELQALRAEFQETEELHREEHLTYQQQWESATKRLRAEHHDEVTNLKESYAAERAAKDTTYKQTVDSMQATHATERTAMLEEHRILVETLQSTYAAESAARDEEYRSTLTTLKASHQTEMYAKEEAHRNIVTALQATATATCAELDDEKSKRLKADRWKKHLEAETQKLKAQLHAALTTGGSGSSANLDVAVTEMKSMQAELDAAKKEVSALRSALGGQGEPSISRASVGISGGAQRASGKSSLSAVGYLEQAELNDARVDALTKEKRVILAEKLEEVREKQALQQELLVMGKEKAALAEELRSARLEKSRFERMLMKVGINTAPNNENVHSNRIK